jgi:pre-mRNA cleavage complex 2 protein Pcf11
MEATEGDDSNTGRSTNNPDNVISCPASSDDVNKCCDMCHDAFEQFFNEETEDWHLRSCIKVEDKCFHPICYEDYKVNYSY